MQRIKEFTDRVRELRNYQKGNNTLFSFNILTLDFMDQLSCVTSCECYNLCRNVFILCTFKTIYLFLQLATSAQAAFISTKPFKFSGPPSHQVNCSRTRLHSAHFQIALIPLSSLLHFLYSCLHIFISNRQNPVTRCFLISSTLARAGNYQSTFPSRKPLACSSPFASHSLTVVKVNIASSIWQ